MALLTRNTADGEITFHRMMTSKLALRRKLTAALALEKQPKISHKKGSLHHRQKKEVWLHSQSSCRVKNYITWDPLCPQEPSRSKARTLPIDTGLLSEMDSWFMWCGRACFHSSLKRSRLPRPGAAIRSPAGWGLSVGQSIVRLSQFPLEPRRDWREASCICTEV